METFYNSMLYTIQEASATRSQAELAMTYPTPVTDILYMYLNFFLHRPRQRVFPPLFKVYKIVLHIHSVHVHMHNQAANIHDFPCTCTCILYLLSLECAFQSPFKKNFWICSFLDIQFTSIQYETLVQENNNIFI